MMKLFSVLIFLLAAACGGGGSDNSFTAVQEGGYYDEYEEILEDEAEFSVEQKEQAEQKIIKTAQLVFESKDPTKKHAEILQLATQHNGIVQSDNASKGYNRINRTIVVRIPSEKFASFIEGVSQGVAFFDQRTISRQDVSEEFVDLEARLKAKRELESRYLELLKQAKNVKEMLEIERELSKIREEIEARQGRLQYLQNRVSLSTVTIEVYKTTSETGITESYGQKMKNALAGGWDGISMFFLGILYVWPLLLFFFIVFLIIRWLIKRNKIKK